MRLRPFRSFAVAPLGVFAVAALLSAQTPEMNVKPGLWELTMTVDLGGAGGVDTSKMTPEQKAQLDAMMRGRGMGGPMVVKNCMTKEKLAEHKYTVDRPGSTCTSKVTKQTATSVDMTQTCTGANASVSEMHIEATSPTAMKMTAKQTSGRGAPASVTMTGKWVSDNCGDVK